jgi:hypothetical protein
LSRDSSAIAGADTIAEHVVSYLSNFTPIESRHPAHIRPLTATPLLSLYTQQQQQQQQWQAHTEAAQQNYVSSTSALQAQLTELQQQLAASAQVVNDSTNTSTAAVANNSLANNSLFGRMTVGEPLDTEGGWAFSDEDPLLSPVETASRSNALFGNSTFGNSSGTNENADTATAAAVSAGNDEHVAKQQQQYQEQLQALQLQVEQLQTELNTAQAQRTELQSELTIARSAAAAAEDEVTALSHVRRRLEATEVELEKLKLSASGALSSRRLSELEAATPRNPTALATGSSSGVTSAAFFGSSTVASAVTANAALEVAQLQEQLQTTKLEVKLQIYYYMQLRNESTARLDAAVQKQQYQHYVAVCAAS